MSPKKIVLTQKEIDRADEDWTIIRRKQADGGYWVAAVHVPTGTVHLRGEFVDTKEEVPKAIQRVNRWLSKMSAGGKAADRGRMRRWEKEDERKKMGEGVKITKSQLRELIKEVVQEQYREQAIDSSSDYKISYFGASDAKSPYALANVVTEIAKAIKDMHRRLVALEALVDKGNK